VKFSIFLFTKNEKIAFGNTFLYANFLKKYLEIIKICPSARFKMSQISTQNGQNNGHHHGLTLSGLLITLGIIYGDIGTSPLYVMKTVFGTDIISRETIMGAISLVFWTLTIQTSFKYIVLVLRADNNGEGGIFSLYTLVRRKASWLLYPAIIGGASMLAEGMITPPISVSSAIEGLLPVMPNLPVVPIVIAIISLLFAFQRFGTAAVGKFFGPIMFLWFSMLGFLGILQIFDKPEILLALNPFYGIKLLFIHPSILFILGAVFLCTTGAEALYADLGHCGKKNIRASWVMVKSCLVLNYLGQGAWLLKYEGGVMPTNPFYGIMPDWFLVTGVVIAAAATVIASQAMITGSFTLVSEAIRLGFLPKMTVIFPTNMKGQIYVPAVNWMLCWGCIGVVLYFQKSENMEAAYGLSVTATMLMSTLLLANFLIINRVRKFYVWSFLIFYLIFEGVFFWANLAKFAHGGYVTVIIASFIIFLMIIWVEAKKIRRRLVGSVRINDYLDQLIQLSNDEHVPKYATNLVFLSRVSKEPKIEEKIIYSILATQPKRADIYWFVNIQVTDEPYTMDYKVNILAPQDVVKVTFFLGFRVEQRMNVFLKKVVNDLVDNEEINLSPRYHTLRDQSHAGDFKFILIEEFLSHENDLPILEQIIMEIYLTVKSLTGSPKNWFGLDSDSVYIEKIPLVLRPLKGVHLKRIFEE
jgi:KUP system potassium uptake protein